MANSSLHNVARFQMRNETPNRTNHGCVSVVPGTKTHWANADAFFLHGLNNFWPKKVELCPCLTWPVNTQRIMQEPLPIALWFVAKNRRAAFPAFIVSLLHSNPCFHRIVDNCGNNLHRILENFSKGLTKHCGD